MRDSLSTGGAGAAGVNSPEGESIGGLAASCADAPKVPPNPIVNAAATRNRPPVITLILRTVRRALSLPGPASYLYENHSSNYLLRVRKLPQAPMIYGKTQMKTLTFSQGRLRF